MAKTKKFKLGPLQKMWIKQLRKHPERQMKDALGQGTPKDYKACCLGELHICAFRIRKKKLPFTNDNIIDEGYDEDGCDDHNDGVLEYSYEKYGLRSDMGFLGEYYTVKGCSYSNLAAMNDGGMTWPEIADFIEENADSVFTKSV